MAALSRASRIAVRAARPGEGEAIATLWRELWDAHEGWGGYPGCRDPLVYERLAVRLDDDARARGGQPILGRHLHVVATVDGILAGQVEGWVERQGVDPQTPYTCEVRSLIVTSWARGAGVGRALLDGVSEAAVALVRDAPFVLGAEVLAPNPAQTFYAKLGYRPVAWAQQVPADPDAAVLASAHPPSGESFIARRAESRDALALCVLDATLATRRRALGDPRFDPPRAVDAATIAAIAAQLGEGGLLDLGAPRTLELVAVDSHARVRGSATFAASSLDPPFRAGQRAVLGRFAIDPALDPAHVVPPLIALGRRLGAEAGARSVELTELSSPETALYAAGLSSGGVPWSQIVTKKIGRHS
jgi:predicted N-acetyltransferase YhbS